MVKEGNGEGGGPTSKGREGEKWRGGRENERSGSYKFATTPLPSKMALTLKNWPQNLHNDDRYS